MSDRKKIKDFILKNFLFSNDGALDEEESLVRNGVIDSTGVLEVIAFLEEAFGIKVADEEMIPDNLDSVSSMAAFVERKRGA
jgi:acyl carrier protein